MPDGRPARRARGDEATATASFVILFPLLVFVFMALVQWGLYFHAESLVAAAAQDGNRAAQGLDGTDADGEAVARSLLADQEGSGLLEAVSVDIRRDATSVRTVVRAEVRSLVPLPGFDLRVEGVSAGPIEQFVGQDER